MTASAHGEPVPVLEIQNIAVAGQDLRVGIRRGRPDRPPLLVFNGIGANLELVEPFAAALENVELVIFDVPGLGGSTTPLLPYRFASLALLADRLMRQLGYADEIDVLGVSWGGALAQQFAHQFRQRCRRLVLASTSSGAVMVPGRMSALSKMIAPRRYKDPEYLHRVGGDLYGGSYRREPELLREHARHMRSPQGRGYLYQLFAVWGWTSFFWLGSLRQPTLVMHGDDDPIVPLINAKILARRIPKSELFVIDDGHLFLMTRAKEVAPVVEKFLAG
ncbi:MAG: poly(3-hydroxyalkanoate) depolymerase [Rhodocyclaceae bacterium]|nr:poly(3-hydroxyalkanoate) depolymerase [Rhodocyclaceae bacterium]MBX3669718.1 poly(3-hydroxyalkanoate) depolymerase [Rhodocyclaceae bacterium]